MGGECNQLEEVGQTVQASLAVVEQRSRKVEVQIMKKYLQGRRLVGLLVGEVDKVIRWFCLLPARVVGRVEVQAVVA